MLKAEKIDGVYYFRQSREEMLVEELLTTLKSNGVIKDEDIDNIKAKVEAKAKISSHKK